ncbi:MAG: hypothetical protein ACRDYD_08220 [Acidimicrobiales bacterium]
MTAEDVRARLEGIAEELGDLALDRLRQAAGGAGPDAVAEERRLTRARRAVERAVVALDDRLRSPELD